jgi:hypothetical protein
VNSCGDNSTPAAGQAKYIRALQSSSNMDMGSSNNKSPSNNNLENAPPFSKAVQPKVCDEEPPVAISVISIEGGGSVEITDHLKEAPELTMDTLDKMGKNV